MDQVKRKPGRPKKVSVPVELAVLMNGGVETTMEPQAHGGTLKRNAAKVCVNTFDDPLEFLQAVYRGEVEATNAQITAAKAMLPFVHKRLGEEGKKQERKDAAVAVSDGRFASAAPPLRAVR